MEALPGTSLPSCSFKGQKYSGGEKKEALYLILCNDTTKMVESGLKKQQNVGL